MQVISKYLNIDSNYLIDLSNNLLEKIVKSPKLTTLTLFSSFALITSFYYYVKWKEMCKFFPNLKIPGPKPKFLTGDFIKLISMGLSNYDDEVISKYGNILGYWEGNRPVVLCADVDMIKSVMIKDSYYFNNRRVFDGLFIEPLDKWLSNIKDDEWKNARSIVSTTFTSGKLKEMYDTMSPAVGILIEHFDKLAKNGETFEAKELFQKMTFDVIVSCCFGVQTDSINNPDDIILHHLKKLLEGQLSIKVLLAIIFPKLMKYLFKNGYTEHFPQKTIDFFVDLTEMTIKRRKNKEQHRSDFIQIMVDHEEKPLEEDELDNENLSASTGQWKYLKKSLTTKEILAQSILFLFAGSETSASTLGFVSLLLAKNLDVQEKLYEEIKRVFEEHNEINYEMLNEITYLDMVINETMRIYPPALRTDRECNQDYTFKDMKIKKGTIWAVSIWSLHHNPNIWPEPEKFIPERFSHEGKKNRDNCAFIPFGAGPRNCVGMRFALMEIKMLLVKFLLKYKFSVCEKTPDKIEMDNSGLAKSKVPIILKVVDRIEI